MQNDPEVEVEEPLELPAEPAEGEEDLTDWKVEAQKLREKAIAQRERTKTLKQQKAEVEAKLVELAKSSVKTPNQPKTGELDETQLDYLDLKGISESEDLKIIERHVARTGETVRQALKDEYVQAKLNTNKAQREVKDATPSSSKRSSGNQPNDLALAIAKYRESGLTTLPSDFALRSAVINAMEAETNKNKPSWQ